MRRFVSSSQHAEMLLQVATAAAELEELVASYAAAAQQQESLDEAWACMLSCTDAQPALKEVRACRPCMTKRQGLRLV